MSPFEWTPVPGVFKQAMPEPYRGTVVKATYPVRNYITPERRLATDQNLRPEETGRETTSGPAIHKSCNIYLPAGYDANDANTRYNVLYLLHGVGGDEHEWPGVGDSDRTMTIINIADRLIASGEIDPLIIVFPNGRSAHDWTDRSFHTPGTNMLGFYYFDYELRYDLIPYVETHFHTRANIKDTTAEGVEANRMHRAIAGLSMGGMQCLNLVLGGYRCDSTEYTGTNSPWDNGLDVTVRAPGMADLFAYVGAFSNAPTSSGGNVLGSSLASNPHTIRLLYMTCGDADNISFQEYNAAVNNLAESAGDRLGSFIHCEIKDGVHDFHVWNNGAYHFLRSIWE